MLQAHALIAVEPVTPVVGEGTNKARNYSPYGCNAGELERLRPYLMRFARAKFNDVYTAEDLVQETMLAALVAQSPFMSRSVLSTWVTAILKHKIADAYRRKAKENLQHISDAADDHDDGVDRQQMETTLYSKTETETRRTLSDPALEIERRQLASSFMCAVDNLPTRQRDAFMMVHIHGVSRLDAAQRTGVSLNNLWVILHRSRKALKVQLQGAYAI